MNAARLIVEVGHPEAFLVGLLFGKAAREEIAGGRDAGELERDFGTLTMHPVHVSEASEPNDEKRVRIDAEMEELTEDQRKVR